MKPSPYTLSLALALVPLALARVAPARPASVAPEAGLDSLPGWTAGRLAGTGSPSLPYQPVAAFPRLTFDKAVDIDPLPRDPAKRLALLEHNIGVFLIAQSPDAAEKTPFLILPQPSQQPGHPKVSRRLYSITFDPAYPENPYLYLSWNTRTGSDGENTVARFTVDTAADPPVVNPDSQLAILRWTSAGHDGCDLKFGPRDGMLYISTGDGEAPADPANVGQTTDNFLGSILRIDVSSATPGKPYTVPADNPFVDTPGILPEVWAYGLRNPWRMNFRPGTHELFLGDNGDEHWELVRCIRAGTNHGWSAFEGSHPFRLTNQLAGPVTELTVPVYEHPHAEMRSVIGGLFYRGVKFPELAGRYLYGCYFTRKLWALDWNPARQAAANPRRIADIRNQIVGFAEDHDRELLVITFDGPVFRLEPAPADQPANPIPGKLSQTGLFTSTESLAPAPGVLPYAINAPAWFDGAQSIRHFAVAARATAPVEALIGERLHKSWRFPSGSAFARTFTLPHPSDSSRPRRIETQLIHKDGYEWHFLTYRWNEAQNDAVLVPPEGLDTELKLPSGTQPWRFPSRAECTACHTQRSFFVLGFSTEQFDRPFDYSPLGGHAANQIDTLAHLGFFPKNGAPRRVDRDRHPIAPLANPHDPSRPLADRARAYLHVNCAHCHRETGLGGRARFQLLHWLPLSQTGALGTPPLVGLPGPEDPRIIAPGHPGRSEILRRMQTRDAGKMPLIGSYRVDKQGVALIRSWIDSLAPETSANTTK